MAPTSANLSIAGFGNSYDTESRAACQSGTKRWVVQSRKDVLLEYQAVEVA